MIRLTLFNKWEKGCLRLKAIIHWQHLLSAGVESIQHIHPLGTSFLPLARVVS